MTRETQAVKNIEQLAQQLEAFNYVKQHAWSIADEHAYKIVGRAIDALYAIAQEYGLSNCRETLYEVFAEYLIRFCKKALEIAAYREIWPASENTN